MLGTRIYGQSDDNVYCEGDVDGQYSFYGTSDREYGILLIASDGTILEIKYGKGELAIWGINIIRKGELFESIQYCEDEDADIYSDIVHFKEGLKFIYGSSEWERIR